MGWCREGDEEIRRGCPLLLSVSGRWGGVLRGGGTRLLLTKPVAGSGRLGAAFVPTGNERGGEQRLVAWLRKRQYVSMVVGPVRKPLNARRCGGERMGVEDLANGIESVTVQTYIGCVQSLGGYDVRRNEDRSQKHASSPGSH